jgi:7-keto-8-aminopelargonate synthetase-like enzyme
MFQAGIFTNAVISPAVPPDRALIRTSYMATHSDQDLDIILETVKKIGKSMNII